jgi:hypothetical protein
MQGDCRKNKWQSSRFPAGALFFSGQASRIGLGDVADFEAALRNVGFVGITFGGGSEFFGHGVVAEQGTVQVQLISYIVRNSLLLDR